MKSCLCAVVAILWCAGLWAQDPVGRGIRPLTDADLKEAIAFGESDGAAVKVSDMTSTVVLFLMVHDMKGPARTDRMQAMIDAPYQISIFSPFTRAAMEAAEAKRKFLPTPALKLEELNLDAVQVRVGPGSNFTSFGTIENVVVKRGDEVTRPVKADVHSTTIQNRMGATATAAEGVFTFDFSAFEPSKPVKLVLIGKDGNYEWPLEAAELARLR